MTRKGGNTIRNYSDPYSPLLACGWYGGDRNFDRKHKTQIPPSTLTSSSVSTAAWCVVECSEC